MVRSSRVVDRLAPSCSSPISTLSVQGRDGSRLRCQQADRSGEITYVVKARRGHFSYMLFHFSIQVYTEIADNSRRLDRGGADLDG